MTCKSIHLYMCKIEIELWNGEDPFESGRTTLALFLNLIRDCSLNWVKGARLMHTGSIQDKHQLVINENFKYLSTWVNKRKNIVARLKSIWITKLVWLIRNKLLKAWRWRSWLSWSVGLVRYVSQMCFPLLSDHSMCRFLSLIVHPKYIGPYFYNMNPLINSFFSDPTLFTCLPYLGSFFL